MSAGGLITVVTNMRAFIEASQPKTESGGVNGAVKSEEDEAEYDLEQKVQDRIEDCSAVRVDDIATLRQGPANGVHDPDESSPCSPDEEGFANIGTKELGVTPGLEEKLVNDIENRHAAKDEEGPFVAGGGECTNEEADGSDPGNEDSPKDLEPGSPSRQH